MRNPLPLLWLLLVAWCLGGAYFYSQYCCNAFQGQSFSIADEDKVVASSSDNLQFLLSNADPIISKKMDKALGQLVDYLKANPNKRLLLTGSFIESESNSTEFDNLGLARAELIKQELINRGVNTLQLITSSQQDNALENNKKMAFAAVDFTLHTDTFLSIRDGDDFSAGAADNLKFPVSGFEYAHPFSSELAQAFQQTAAYLIGHPDRSLTITGQYAPLEDNQSMYPNLGEARANMIKNYLIDLGVNPRQIIVESGELRSFNPMFDPIFGAAEYTFTALAQPEDVVVAREVEKELKKAQLVLYFETGQSSLNLSDEERQLFVDIIEYMRQHPEAKISAIGHTDNVGGRAKNVQLSNERAVFAKNYLVRNGIKEERIVTGGKGPDQPLENNNTEEGKAKNRRVEVKLD